MILINLWNAAEDLAGTLQIRFSLGYGGFKYALGQLCMPQTKFPVAPKDIMEGGYFEWIFKRTSKYSISISYNEEIMMDIALNDVTCAGNTYGKHWEDYFALDVYFLSIHSADTATDLMKVPYTGKFQKNQISRLGLAVL